MLAGIDIGGTKISIGVADSPGKILAQETFRTPPNQNQALNTMLETLQRLANNRRIHSLGIASPGPIDRTAGVILSPRHLHWKNVPICRFFKSKLGCLTTLDHDATLGGVAEARLGVGKGKKIVLYVTISTGIGSAIIIDGKPLPSQYNSEGGWQIVQFRPFPPKSFSSIASGSVIKKQYGKIAKEITSKRDWDNIAKNISVGLFNFITIIQPDIVVLGGGVGTHYQHFSRPLQDYLKKYHSLYPLPSIKKARFSETAPLLGALIMAKDEISPIK